MNAGDRVQSIRHSGRAVGGERHGEIAVDIGKIERIGAGTPVHRRNTTALVDKGVGPRTAGQVLDTGEGDIADAAGVDTGDIPSSTGERANERVSTAVAFNAGGPREAAKIEGIGARPAGQLHLFDANEGIGAFGADSEGGVGQGEIGITTFSDGIGAGAPI